MSESGRYLVLGTAGHIDHGKTALIKALTGIDCDTLAEEKQRGITIVLGFAYWDLPDGTRLGVVDVPGHRRFVRSMVAGASGIHLVLLVVAADDGVMPQTREHLHIARLLGVEKGLVALTKVDLVDEDLRDLAIADVEELIAGTFLEDCPVIPVSVVTGSGLDELTQATIRVAAEVSPSHGQGPFRLPVDRVFTVKGAGTVVTGTTLSGEVAVDNELELVPGGQRGRVRSIEVHGTQQQRCGAGHRAALNLVGIDRDEIQRGHMLAAPGSLLTTFMLDAQIELLDEVQRPLRRGSEVMLHVGTAEHAAKLFPLDVGNVAPGSAAIVQLRLSQETATAVGDRFILRDSASEHTIGGGRVLDAHPMKHRRKRHEAAAQLARLRGVEAAAAVLHEVNKSPYGLELAQVQLRLLLGADTLDESIAHAREADPGLLVHHVGNQRILTVPANRQRMADAAAQALVEHHAANPLRQQGLTAKALLKAIDRTGAGITAEVLAAALDEAVVAGQLVKVGETYSVPRGEITLSARDNKSIELLLTRLNASVQPDQPNQIATELPVDRKRLAQLLDYLVETGQAATHGGMYFGARIVERAQAALLKHFERESGVTVSQFGKLVGTTRKFSLPLLNYFEQVGMLKRVGNERILSNSWSVPREGSS